jgi:thiol-disulfide isomerase/thioredoxin
MENVTYLEGSDINQDGSIKPHALTGKPIIVMVQGNFCGHCTRAKPAFAQFAKNPYCSCMTVQIDGDEGDKAAGQALSAVNKSPGVPVFLGFSRDGKYVKVCDGPRTPESWASFAKTL